MTRREITALRLRAQQIAIRRSRTPGELVAALGAMQAQDYLGALWSIGLRLPGITEVEVERAIADRQIVRTWPMRGTLHFVAAADVRWMLPLLSPRVVAGAATRHHQLELTDADFTKARKILQRALRGQPMARPAVFETLEKAGITPTGQRGYHILWKLAQDGFLCFGPREGKQPTFALLDEWLPIAKTIDREAALAELALRYFTSHGPATSQDFVWWTGLKVTDARAGLESVRQKLAQETSGDQTYWMAPDLKAPPADSSATFLLPGFDEYLLGYTDRSAALDAQHAPKIVPGGNGMFMPTIVTDGRVTGTWKRTLKKSKALIAPIPFKRLTKAELQAFASAAEGYSKFLGLPVECVADTA